MKIGIVSIIFNTKGGSERRVYQLTKGLIAAGHEVEIFASEVADLDLGAKVTRVPMSGGPSFTKLLSFRKNLLRMLKGRGDIDIVHNQIRPFTDGVVTVGGGCHAEYLETSGNAFSRLNPLHRVILGLEREMYKKNGCGAVITNSKLAKYGIMRYYPVPDDKVFVAYNGVDLDKFNPGQINKNRANVRQTFGFMDEPVILFLGSGFRRKGLETLIKALPVVRTMKQEISRTKVLVVGKDDPRPYARLAARLGVDDMLRFAGQTTEPEQFYGAADIFALPTAYDPFSNATLEAMACGLPVITSASNGASEVITDGEDGFILKKADDHTALAATLGYLSCEKARAEAGAKARRTAQGFTWDKTLRKTLEVYEAIVHERKTDKRGAKYP